MPPKDTLWRCPPETAAKHQVLKGYLDAWFPIMGMRGGRLVVIDGFAGPGRYADGEDGSPLIMLKALLKHRLRQRITADVAFLFIEEDARRVKHLEGELASINLGRGVRVIVRQGRFHEQVGPLLDHIEARGANLAPTFAFIDPFGYQATHLDLTGRIQKRLSQRSRE